jgi:hypothetical protein
MSLSVIRERAEGFQDGRWLLGGLEPVVFSVN